jgi:hypothetical protein
MSYAATVFRLVFAHRFRFRPARAKRATRSLIICFEKPAKDTRSKWGAF